jgi:hypothetical protein
MTNYDLVRAHGWFPASKFDLVLLPTKIDFKGVTFIPMQKSAQMRQFVWLAPNALLTEAGSKQKAALVVVPGSK